MPIISAIVPIYNSEKYLEACIDSILAQTFTDFELILIDDGSTDSSGIICDRYAQKDNRVVVIHKENAGVSAARNDGINLAKGEYITFVDSDDTLEENFLENAYEKIGENDLYISGIKMITFNNSLVDSVVTYGIKESRVLSVVELLETLTKEFPEICISGPCCKLYKKEIINMNDISFDVSLTCGEDTCFNIDYLSKIDFIYFDKNSYYNYYRINENSLFSRYYRNMYEIYYLVFSKFFSLLKEKKSSETGINNITKLYVIKMISAIIHIHEYSKSFKEKLSVIKKVENNPIVQEFNNEISGGTGVVLKTIKLKMTLVSHLLILYIVYKAKKAKQKKSRTREIGEKK